MGDYGIYGDRCEKCVYGEGCLELRDFQREIDGE